MHFPRGHYILGRFDIALSPVLSIGIRLGSLRGRPHAFAYLNNDHRHSTGATIGDCEYAVHMKEGLDMTASPRSGRVFGGTDLIEHEKDDEEIHNGSLSHGAL